MKVCILAGGLGTRLSEETTVKPKPMVEIAGKPILWHIMKIYASYGFKEFVVALGYKGDVIKDYFLNYHHRVQDLTVHLGSGEISVHPGNSEDWVVHLVDTGLDTQTGGRVKRLAQLIGHETFMLTYGDGVADVDLLKLLEFHHRNGRLATVTAVRPPARFGSIVFKEEEVSVFQEKPQTGEGWINGGYFVFEPAIVDYIQGDQSILEREPMEKLANDGQLVAYRHDGFWQCMDTMRDVRLLDDLWHTNRAPWKVWRD